MNKICKAKKKPYTNRRGPYLEMYQNRYGNVLSFDDFLFILEHIPYITLIFDEKHRSTSYLINRDLSDTISISIKCIVSNSNIDDIIVRKIYQNKKEIQVKNDQQMIQLIDMIEQRIKIKTVKKHKWNLLKTLRKIYRKN